MTFSIGRNAENDIVLSNPSVSRRHADLVALGYGVWRLVDLNSTSGTFIRKGMNWEKISVARVDGNDEVRFGPSPATEYSIKELIDKVKNLQIKPVPVPPPVPPRPKVDDRQPDRPESNKMEASGSGAQQNIAINIGTGTETAADRALHYDANKKSNGVAYVLWFFLGFFGAHRFYLGATGTAVAQLLLNIFGWLTILFGVGIFILVAVWVWLIVDAFLIPNMVRRLNNNLIANLNKR